MLEVLDRNRYARVDVQEMQGPIDISDEVVSKRSVDSISISPIWVRLGIASVD